MARYFAFFVVGCAFTIGVVAVVETLRQVPNPTPQVVAIQSAHFLGRALRMTNRSDFRCPGCGARYQVEQISEHVDTLSEFVCWLGEIVYCKHCLHSFPSRQGDFSLKYLLIAHPGQESAL